MSAGLPTLHHCTVDNIVKMQRRQYFLACNKVIKRDTPALRQGPHRQPRPSPHKGQRPPRQHAALRRRLGLPDR